MDQQNNKTNEERKKNTHTHIQLKIFLTFLLS